MTPMPIWPPIINRKEYLVATFMEKLLSRNMFNLWIYYQVKFHNNKIFKRRYGNYNIVVTDNKNNKEKNK